MGVNDGSGLFDGVIQAQTPVTGAINLVKMGAGTQTLSGLINSGTLTVKDGRLILARPAGGSNAYTGTTSVNGGTLELAYASVTTDNLSSSTPLTMGGGTLQMTGAATVTETVNGLTTTANSASQILLGANKTLTLGALTSAGANSALNFNTAAGGADAGTAAVGTSRAVLTGQVAGAVINTRFTVTDSTGFGLATVNASNQVVRSTNVLDTVALPVAGASSLVNYRVSSASGNLTLTTTANESAGSITVDTTGGSGTLTIGSGFTLNNSVWNFGAASGTNAYAINGPGKIAAASAGGTTNFSNYNPGTVTIGAEIADNTSASAVVFGGTGTTVLTGANTYTGATAISSGVVKIQNAAALGTSAGGTTVASGASLQIDGTFAVGEALTLSGTGAGTGSGVATGALRNISGNTTWNGTITLADAARINSDSGTLTLGNASSVNGAGFRLFVGGSGNTTVSGAVSGAGTTLIKDGAGSLTLSGANTYTNDTCVRSGTLLVNGTHAAGSGAYLVDNSGGSTGTLGGYGTITTTGNVTIATTGQITGGVIGSVDATDAQNILHINGNLVLSGAYLCDINYNGASGNQTDGDMADVISVTGNVDLTDAKLVLAGTNNIPALGTHYAIKLFEWTGSATGATSDWNVANITGLQAGQTVVRWGNAYYLVPEPASFALLGLGSLLLLRRPSRRRGRAVAQKA